MYMNLCNTQESSKKMETIVAVASYEDGEWNSVDTAAEKLKVYVQELQALGNALSDHGDLGEIVDADLNSVDWIDLIVRQLTQINFDEGRPAEAGLARWQR
ncbi:hypothetical protein [Gordonia sihwensis]|uniref:hypothetical protein n=1 Tax=Gordonia sihwensis TaxID=173559 RepID=UPI003D985599